MEISLSESWNCDPLTHSLALHVWTHDLYFHVRTDFVIVQGDDSLDNHLPPPHDTGWLHGNRVCEVTHTHTHTLTRLYHTHTRLYHTHRTVSHTHTRLYHTHTHQAASHTQGCITHTHTHTHTPGCIVTIETRWLNQKTLTVVGCDSLNHTEVIKESVSFLGDQSAAAVKECPAGGVLSLR